MTETPALPRVLVVDDEPMMLRVIARELRDAFDVVLADGLAHATEALARHEDLAAVVSDFDLGRGTTGLQVLDEARRRRPRAARILMSGKVQPDEVADDLRSGLVGCFLQKPWRLGALKADVEQAIAAGCTINAESAMNKGTLAYCPPQDQVELLERAHEGDDDAGETLFQRYRPLVMAILVKEYRIPAADVEDVFQLVHVRYFRHIRRLDRPRGFLRAVAETACLQYHRDRNTEARAMEQFALLHPPSGEGFQREEQRIISRLDIGGTLRTIGERCAEIVRSVVLGQVTQEEYARENEMARGTIGPAVVRCLRKLRSFLGGAGYSSRAMEPLP